MLAEAWRLHERFGTELQEETGVNTEFRLRPSLALAFSDDEAAQLRASLKVPQHPDAPSTRWVDAKEVFEIEPRVNPAAIGGVYVEGGGDVEPYRLTLALVQAAEREGATVRHGTVTGLRVEGGRVRGVALDSGEIACETVVLAMGPWSADASGVAGRAGARQSAEGADSAIARRRAIRSGARWAMRATTPPPSRTGCCGRARRRRRRVSTTGRRRRRGTR